MVVAHEHRMSRHHISDDQWKLLEPLCFVRRVKNVGVRAAKAARIMFDGILRILRIGAPWRDLPDCKPPQVSAIQK